MLHEEGDVSREHRMQAKARRRIDRVTDPAYLHGLAERSLDEIRTMRNDCRDEGDRLSYTRRLIHGQLDVIRAELRLRDGAEGSLLTALPEILADEPTGSARSASAVGFYDPTEQRGRRVEDQYASSPELSTLPELGDDEVRALVERLEERERTVSQTRRIVLDHLDALQDELVERYRDGRADVTSAVAAVEGAGG